MHFSSDGSLAKASSKCIEIGTLVVPGVVSSVQSCEREWKYAAGLFFFFGLIGSNGVTIRNCEVGDCCRLSMLGHTNLTLKTYCQSSTQTKISLTPIWKITFSIAIVHFTFTMYTQRRCSVTFSWWTIYRVGQKSWPPPLLIKVKNSKNSMHFFENHFSPSLTR